MNELQQSSGNVNGNLNANDDGGENKNVGGRDEGVAKIIESLMINISYKYKIERGDCFSRILTDYLPSNTETKTGLQLMEKEFGTLTSVTVMIKDVSEEEALGFYEKIKNTSNVDIVMFNLTDSYYKDKKVQLYH